jgi:cytochrome c-type biogenesis protein CcmH/NrfG
MDIKTAISYIYSDCGKQRQQEGKLEEAIALYRQAIEIKPDEYYHYYCLGLLLIEAKQIDKAIECYRQALELNPTKALIYYQLALIFHKKNQFTDAIAYYHQAIDLEPNNADFYCFLGEALFKNNQLEAAIIAHQKVIEIERKCILSYYYLGRIRRQQKRYKEAIIYFQKAIEIDPKIEQAYLALQYVPVESDQLDELIAFYQKIIEQTPDTYLAWGNLGDILTQKRQLSEAICCYQTSCYHHAVNTNPHLATLDWKLSKTKAPDFIIVGAGKCGTSSLFRYLGQHPQILLPHKKELNFFTTENFDKGFDWYLSHFPAITDYPDFLTGEASPAYFNHPLAIDKIPQVIPDTKLIFLLRNPVHRIISWYYHNLQCGHESRFLEEIIDLEKQQLKSTSKSKIDSLSGYIFDSIYVFIIKKWLAKIPQKNLLILQTEDLADCPDKTLAMVYDFLDLPNYKIAEYIKYNENYYNLDKHQQLIKDMSNFFLAYNQQLEEYLEIEFNW